MTLLPIGELHLTSLGSPFFCHKNSLRSNHLLLFPHFQPLSQWQASFASAKSLFVSPSPFPDFFGWFFKDQVKSCLHEAFPYSPIKPSLISPFFRPLQHLRVHAACFRLCVLFANCFLSVTTKLYLLQGEGLLFFIVVSAVSSVNLVGIVVVCFGQETHYRIVLRYVSTSQ